MSGLYGNWITALVEGEELRAPQPVTPRRYLEEVIMPRWWNWRKPPNAKYGTVHRDKLLGATTNDEEKVMPVFLQIMLARPALAARPPRDMNPLRMADTASSRPDEKCPNDPGVFLFVGVGDIASGAISGAQIIGALTHVGPAALADANLVPRIVDTIMLIPCLHSPSTQGI